MENINNFKNIYDLMKSDGGAKIFNYYGIETATKKTQKNPFAQKANKKKTSVFLTNFGMYYFKEWNTGVEGTAFDFIQEYEGLDKEATTEKIFSIYGQNLIRSNFNIYPKYNQKNKIEVSILKPSELRKTDILKLDSNFHHYFRNHFCISDEHFLRWGIGTNQNKETCFALQNINQEIINIKYVNYHLSGKRNKETTPYSLPKKTDIYGNLIGKFEMCLFGEHLLTNTKNEIDTKKIIIFVESEKTAFLASYFYPDYQWISAGSANGLTEERINNIKDFLENKRIIWLCDADEAGRKASSIKNLRNKGFQIEVIDLFPEFGTGTNPTNKGYDLADYIIDNQENYLKGKKLDILENGFGIDKYISELWENNLAFKNLITKDNLKLIIQSGTGTGKTTFSEELGLIWHKKNNFPTVIAVPLNAIAENKHATHKIKCEKEGLSKNNAIPYFISSSFNKKNIQNTIHELQESKVMYSNFDALPKVCQQLKQIYGGYNQITDEQHTLITDSGFRNKIVKQVKEHADNAQMSVMFSGTVINVGMENYQFLNIALKNRKNRKITAYELKSEKEISTILVDNLINTRHKSIVLFNSGKQLIQLQNLLQKKGKKSIIIKSEEELLYNLAYKSLMKDCKYPDAFDVLLCTSVVATGIDIITDETIEMHYVNQQWGYDFILSEQFMARLRNQNKGLFFSYSKQNNYAVDNYNLEKVFKKMIHEFEYRSHKFKKENNKNLLDFNKKSPIKTSYDEFLEIYGCDKNGNFAPDVLKVAFLAHQKNISYSSIFRLQKNNDLEIITPNFENKKEIMKILKENKDNFKLRELKEEQRAYQLFVKEPQNYALALASCTNDKTLKEFIIKRYTATEKILPQNYFDVSNKENYYLELEVAEKLFSSVMKCEELGILEDNIVDFLFDNNNTFVNKNKLSEQLNGIKLLCVRYLKNEAKQKTQNWNNIAQEKENFFEYAGELLNQQIEQHEKIQTALKQEFDNNNQKLTNEQIQKIINQYRIIAVSKNKSIRYLKSLFLVTVRISTLKDGKKVRHYIFQDYKNFEHVCLESNISEKSIQSIIKNQFQYLRNCKLLQNKNVIVLEQDIKEKCSIYFEQWYASHINQEIHGKFENLSKNDLDLLKIRFEEDIWLQNNPCPF